MKWFENMQTWGDAGGGLRLGHGRTEIREERRRCAVRSARSGTALGARARDLEAQAPAFSAGAPGLHPSARVFPSR